MKGMELSKAYFEEYGREMIDSRLSMYREYMAVGLVGEGSECFGFDDQLSTDHDFGPAFCIWIPENLYDKAGAAIQEEYTDVYRPLRAGAESAFLRRKAFTVSLRDLTVLPPTTWSGSGYRNTFLRRL